MTVARKRAARANRSAVEKLVIDVRSPGMTPLLRAGVGGLAASIYALAKDTGGNGWPDKVSVGPGSVSVGEHSVTLDLNGAPAREALEALFEASFRLSDDGLIDLPGAYSRSVAADLPLLAALQSALKRTFLQHGSSTQGKRSVTLSFEVDGRSVPVSADCYTGFNHRDKAVAEIVKALNKGHVPLAGWAYPGAAQRHVMFGDTKASYSAEQAIAACFALVGNLSLNGPGRSGVLVTLEPNDLRAFATRRSELTPSRVTEATVCGPSDAVLLVNLAMRNLAEHGRRGVGDVSAVLLKPMAWDSKQKYRARTVTTPPLDDAQLDRYAAVSQSLPQRIRIKRETKQGRVVEGYFVATSALRAFVAENLAAGVRWYEGFSTAKTDDGRIIHRFKTRDDGLGALFPEDRKGIIVMVEYLDDAERALIRCVHQALKQRFGAIAEQNSGNVAARNNRFQSERDRWRHAFAGAKTHEQVRKAVADLWSSAGGNRELQASWEVILPLLRQDRWTTLRDLSLVALASYAAQSKAEEEVLGEPTGGLSNDGEE